MITNTQISCFYFYLNKFLRKKNFDKNVMKYLNPSHQICPSKRPGRLEIEASKGLKEKHLS